MYSNAHDVNKISETTRKERLIRQKELLEIVGCSPSTLKRKVQKGEFPAPVRIGERSKAWKASEVFAWLEKLPKVASVEG